VPLCAEVTTGGEEKITASREPCHSGARAHDPEKWEPVFGQDHAQTDNLARDPESITTIGANFLLDLGLWIRDSRWRGFRNNDSRLAGLAARDVRSRQSPVQFFAVRKKCPTNTPLRLSKTPAQSPGV
jgi:hypothetical protein